MKVRLRPHNPDAGNLMRNYTAPWGDTFHAGTWYDIDDSMEEHIEYLRGVRQRNRDMSSLLAFDIVSTSEARAIRQAEESAALGRVVAVSAIDTGPRAPIARPVIAEDRELNAPTPTHELTAVDAAAEPKERPKRPYTRRQRQGGGSPPTLSAPAETGEDGD